MKAGSDTTSLKDILGKYLFEGDEYLVTEIEGNIVCTAANGARVPSAEILLMGRKIEAPPPTL